MDLPPAPTPPANSSMASSSDRTANLLNLLKFSGGGSSSSQQQSPAHHAQSQSQGQASHQHDDQSPRQQLPHQAHGQFSNPIQSHGPQQHLHQMAMPAQGQFQTRIHQPAPTAADPSGLLAALMRGAQDSEEPKPVPGLVQAQQQALHHQHQQSQSQGSQNPFGGEPSADTTSYLLNLLNRPKPGQNEQPILTERSRSNNQTPQSPDSAGQANRRQSHYQPPPSSYVSMSQHQTAESFVDVEHPTSGSQPQSSNNDYALYQQLMGSLNQSSPKGPEAQPSHASSPYHILKMDHSSPAGSHHRAGSERSPINSPADRARRQQPERASSLHSHQSSRPTPPADRAQHPTNGNKETVSDAIGDLAQRVDHDAREAVDQAEKDQAHSEIADDLDGMMHAKSNNEFDAKAHAAAQLLQKELSRDENHDTLEDHLPPDVAQTVREIVDEAAAQNVADSWESADQDEIVVIEEKEIPPIKVYNFPMKPWISISLQDEKMGPLPEFRDEAIMDIARLRKEFDQIDRNLYTASQNYMTYGMSKHGGLRVIRQDDGKDAKVFAETKDRIFNVAISVTPTDYEGAQREAIIGTGISGTVYWVQIKDGEKDHVDDAHLEQYGFALPPISTGEGDAPGGALKTRARASTIHPEFFAVGRGKSINLIWPSYIMQNQIFKPGHDRVVDTDRLSKQCSLKINTGKAGKDFTFSQDDTVVVSLDKSGRVKFWDVRDLTAVKEGSDPRSPMPAHSSFEVKDPLMTLASTPEGEKAWPTSVLLLDKMRPYQKRCALRYMIVGMKQNHTLQLWDLALGKPVQEFNLPHSKESDAVCSVMYHPTTGMIVIGHPTRNSVYFAHLSAPKYNLKSVSQAEYVQRLVAQDASMPQPDSTAVISGVREYSFENRGMLRSLDILCNPAMAYDAEEPTLFELYAMHSKGVACLLIKQMELGWSKDNKVLNAVDAVNDGAVTVSKLKTMQAVEANNGSDVTQSRNASRGVSKESFPPATTSQSDITQNAFESVTPGKPKAESKEPETPLQSKDTPTEKSDRKSRKKRAAAANTSDAAANGPSSQPSFTPSAKSEASKANSGMVSGGWSTENVDTAIAAMESRLNMSLSDSVRSQLRNLNGKIDDSNRARDDAFNKHQLKLLDMVSEVLNENTQKVLEALVHQQFTELVIPAIGEKAGRAVTDLLNNRLQPNVAASVQKEIQNALPHALNRALRSSDIVSSISDRVGSSLAATMQQEVVSSLAQRLTPALSSMAKQSASNVAAEIQQQHREQYEHMKAQHLADTNKIDQLLSYVTRLTDMVSTMAASQSALQAEFLKLKQPVHELPGISGMQGSFEPQNFANSVMSSNKPPSHQGSYAASQAGPNHPQSYIGSPQYVRGSQHMPSPHGSAHASERGPPGNHMLSGGYANQHSQHGKNDVEADHEMTRHIRSIEQAIQEGRLQEGMIQWIQSGREEEIFKRCLSRYPPNKFEGLPPLMLLVLIATLSKDLKPKQGLKEEVDWIEMAVRAFGENLPGFDWEQPGFPEVMRSTTQTLQLLISRIRPLLGSIQDGFPTDPFLVNLDRGKLDWILRTSERILGSFDV